MLAALALPRTLVTLLLAASTFASPVPLPQSELEAIAAEKGTVWGEDGFVPAILISYSVPITYPTAGVEWRAGGEGYLEWNPVLPAGITPEMVAKTARLILGYTTPDSIGLNLDLDRPLGLDIPLYEGPTRYNFTLPSDLPSRSTYILSFQGSSGNISPEFTIIGSTTSESASPTTTTTAWVDTIPWETPTQTGSGTMATETEVSVQTTLPVSGADRSTSTLAPTATGVAAPATTLSTSGAGRRGGWTGAVGAILLVGAMVV